MKKLVILLMAVTALLSCGCKSHKKALVSVQPEFQPEEVWVLTAMREKEVVYQEGQRRCTIQVNPEAGTFNGCSGCNRYFGTFTDLGGGRFQLSDFNGTKMACPAEFMKLESSYMQLLRRADTYSIGEYTLDLLQGETVLLSFSKQSDEKE